MALTHEEAKRRERLMDMQADHNRPMMQEEFEELQSLHKKCGGPSETYIDGEKVFSGIRESVDAVDEMTKAMHGNEE